jgi:hypothetical protein
MALVINTIAAEFLGKLVFNAAGYVGGKVWGLAGNSVRSYLRYTWGNAANFMRGGISFISNSRMVTSGKISYSV